MAQKSIKKNYIYNLSYQILLLITPLITTPYLSRVLGADGIGAISFAESIVCYFTLFAALGISLYGQRKISYVQDSLEKRSIVFWENVLLKTLTTTLVLAIYIPFSLLQNRTSMFLILSLNLVSVVVDITWFFQGLEEFGKIVLRNFIIKIINVAYIFLFVRNSDCIYIYVFGLAFFPVIGNISLWFYLPKYIKAIPYKLLTPTKNIKEIISLFIPTVAIQIYTVLDKTMIGLITNSDFENGYYEQSIKLSKMVLMVVTALGTVMMPRIGYHFSKGDKDKVNEFMYRAYQFVWCLGIPLCFGLIGISSNFVPWFFGDGFDKVVPLLRVLSFLILAIGINNVTGMQYLIPTGRQNTFTLTVLIGAAVNFTLNIVLIQYLQSIGAAIASVVAETAIALVQLFIVRKEFSLRTVFSSCIKYLFSGLLMLIYLFIIGSILSPAWSNTILMVASGGIIYIVFLLLFKDRFFIDNIMLIFSKLIKKTNNE